MTAHAPSSAGAFESSRPARGLMITVLTAVLALVFGLLVMASVPGVQEPPPQAALPVAAVTAAASTSVPQARLGAVSAPEQLPASF